MVLFCARGLLAYKVGGARFPPPTLKHMEACLYKFTSVDKNRGIVCEGYCPQNELFLK
jgi:hypothetical protein